MAEKNQHGRIYDPGKPLSDQFRGEILNMFNRGFSKKAGISWFTGGTKYCQKDIRHHDSRRYGTFSVFSHGGSESRKVMDDVL